MKTKQHISQNVKLFMLGFMLRINLELCPHACVTSHVRKSFVTWPAACPHLLLCTALSVMHSPSCTCFHHDKHTHTHTYKHTETHINKHTPKPLPCLQHGRTVGMATPLKLSIDKVVNYLFCVLLTWWLFCRSAAWSMCVCVLRRKGRTNKSGWKHQEELRLYSPFL